MWLDRATEATRTQKLRQTPYTLHSILQAVVGTWWT